MRRQSPEIVAAVAERAPGRREIRMRRMGFADTTCPTSPWLEAGFYPDPRRSRRPRAALVRPGEGFSLADVPPAGAMQFKGPF